jgi:hypothetical protein
VKIAALGFRKTEDEIQFLRDPYLSPEAAKKKSADGNFSEVRPLATDEGGTLHCNRDFALERR